MLAFPNLKILGFHDCSFEAFSSDLKLGTTTDFTIEEISFEETLDWSLTSDSFEHILSGFKKSSIKSSLKKLNITRANYFDTQLRSQLTKYGFDDVSVTTDIHWYFYNL